MDAWVANSIDPNFKTNQKPLERLTARHLLLCFFLLLTSFSHVLHADFDAGLQAFGEGRMQDARVAWQKSATDGHQISQFLLGQLYDQGSGVESDIVLAHRWYCLAASNGYDEAIPYCTRIERSMTDEQKKRSVRVLQSTMSEQQPAIDSNAKVAPVVATLATASDLQTELDAELSVDFSVLSGRGAADTVLVKNSASEDSENRWSITVDPAPFVAAEVATKPSTVTVDEERHDQQLIEVQQMLTLLGRYAGRTDGLMGPNTRLAIAAFKRQAGLEPDDRIDPSTVRAIRGEARRLGHELLQVPVEDEER